MFVNILGKISNYNKYLRKFSLIANVFVVWPLFLFINTEKP